ncbi:receptor-type tyrosine-protein phosphatase delta-like isoform X2 [Dendronephthya gigantea]|uniref:receptor-type tyrosine-protein phosphatase delta-like isoform X2 n=2 Tax=Dendronephthya gigantea TaxID=151771 RepID=UPI001068F9BA|nr:receptor-type tyrosine-protein phosphatase delta-like isoform X2 [Dendronephthya gigantea]
MSLLFYTWLIFCGMSLLAFEDCRGFFMRQSSAPRKCITRRNGLIYNDPSHALPYWVILKDNCLDDKAQFRYNDTEILWHIESGGALNSATSSTYRNLFSIYVAISPVAKNTQIKSRQNFKQTDAGSLYFYNDRRCGEPYRDYVYRRTYCDRSSQKFTFGSVTQFGDKMKDVNCSPIQRMVIHKAYYGNFNNSGRFNSSAYSDAQCTAVTSCRLKSLCGGKKSCELNVDNNLLLPNLCSNTRKELYTEYTCVDNYTNPITTVSGLQIRLSSGYRGYLYIYEKTWVEVSEENLDENSERWICQHLGFQDRLTNGISFRNASDKESIVAGDLVCYNITSGGTSCCVYLQPKTATSADKIPYVECKICDNQLLNDNSSFPDNIFGGNGGNSFHKARFTKGGWCSSTPGSYLTIDLPKEYHITRVMVMGDKDQTKWSGSYSLKYSHDESLGDSSRAVQILGNTNGYQASTTDVDIYNVRFVKISTDDTDFCLRIEMCGVVQRPGSVFDVRINPSKNSALVTWKLPTSSSSSYIKNLKIYLHGIRRYLLSVPRGNEYNISNLQPYTVYQVGIEAVDDYRQRSRAVYKRFRTKEAAPSGRPYNVKLAARSQTSLNITWTAPHKRTWNAEKLTGFKVCHYIHENKNSLTCISVTSSATTAWSYTYTINRLQSSTKYFVTVSAATVGGVGPKSTTVSGITDGGPVKLLEDTSSTLRINIEKQEDYMKSVIIIVKIDSGETTPVENIKTNSLRSYGSTRYDKPYITAYLKADVLPMMFVIGDGKEYNSKTEKYLNQPLRNNTRYVAFLRFFENEDYNMYNEYYSTAWSKSVKTSKPTVQSLASVQNIVAKPSNSSVHLSWRIPSTVTSTFITHFVIYLNGTEISRISRAYYANQYILRDLKPYTNYVVGIKAQHGVSMNNQPIVYQHFKTTEAVPSGPPRNVTNQSRSENSLQISWKAPKKIFWNGELTGYQICYSTKEKDKRPKCLNMKSLSDLLYTIPNLQPLTKYFVTVSAGTRVGYGNKSLEINEMTNAEPVSFVVMSHLDLKLTISKPASNIREVMVIVKKGTSSLTSSKNIEMRKLGPHRENTQDLYVAAYLKTEDLPLLFVIGDGKEYNSKTEKYVNQPLRTNSSYIVFLRYFENKDLYYSTDWSSSFKTMGKTADGLKRKKSQNSTENETRVELLIPLVILALCFLVSLGVIVYQRRLIQNNKRKANQGHETTMMSDFGPETRKGAKYGQEPDTPINDEGVYETTDDVIDEIERNEGVRGADKGQESSDYMSLKDNKEPANVYQALQPSTSDDVRYHISKEGGQSMECQNPSF